jgi:CHASE3 domain sensor protein
MTLNRKILIGFIACALILVGVAIFSYKNSAKFIASNVWVDHTNQVLSEFNQILVFTINAETGTRGYVITGDENSLEPFFNANTKAAEHLDKVKELTKDNPIQQKNIEELEKKVKMRFDNLNSCIDLRKKNFEQARESIASGEGKRIEDEIRRIIEKAEGIENILLAERKLESNNDASNFNFVFAILLLVIIIILIIVTILLLQI